MEIKKITPFLTFTGKAEEAMNFYANNLAQTEISKIVRYGENNETVTMTNEEKDLILFGLLSIMGEAIMFMDMLKQHPSPAFSWATSLYISCREESEFDSIFDALSKDGTVMMGPEPVAHLRKCAWVTDKFCVTWQIAWE